MAKQVNDKIILEESDKTLKDYLLLLSEKPEVQSFNEMLASILRKEDHFALFGELTLVNAVVGRFLDVVSLHFSLSKEVASKILEAYCICYAEMPSTITNSPFMCYRLQSVLLKSKTFSILAPEDYQRISQGIRYGNSAASKYLRNSCLTMDIRFLQILSTYGLDVYMRRKVVPLEYRIEVFYSAVYSLYSPQGRLAFFKRPAPEHHRLFKIYGNISQDGGRMNSRNQRGCNRIFHIVECLNWMTRFPFFDKDEKEKAVHFLEVQGDMMADPLVSEEEIREFLILLVDHGNGNGSTEEVDQVVHTFVTMYGGRAYEPRSLSHLCRYTIRANIMQNTRVTLPAAVELLDLPGSIKSFLLCNPERLSE